MKLINDRAHDVVDEACKNLTKWPNDFIGQEDLVMLIHGAIEAAVEDERAAWQPIDTAPKDGTWILLRGKNSVGRPMIPIVVAWSFGHTPNDSPCWRDSASLKDLTDVAASPDGAEWMPLPS